MDAKTKLRENGFEVPEYARFMFSHPPIGSRRKLVTPKFWSGLVEFGKSMGVYCGWHSYIKSINIPSPYRLYEQQLRNVQTNNSLNELVNNENPPDGNVSDDDMKSKVHQLGEEEFMGLVAERKAKAKEWVNGLIIIPQSQHILSLYG